ncbi:DUF2064 domain-containing protein [Actinomadura fibrosa]|uniref:DUF2064 domain-containing protein n=1 Tax=Actinomadura fibrosa TaxID=111802 RepID=A0ABW2XY87_9ACTN|nr:DUF2064 domain-containing protein [Actinomadura fibrosa]
MDTPQVTPALLGRARRALARRGAVFGPAADGGFWLLGLRRPDARLLRGVPMSRPDTGAIQFGAAAGCRAGGGGAAPADRCGHRGGRRGRHRSGAARPPHAAERAPNGWHTGGTPGGPTRDPHTGAAGRPHGGRTGGSRPPSAASAAGRVAGRVAGWAGRGCWRGRAPVRREPPR